MSHQSDLLSAFLDGEVTSAERRHAMEHLAGCEVCRDELESLAAARAALRGLPMMEVPDGLLGPAADVAPLHRRPRAWLGAAAAAAAAFIVLATALVPDRPVAVSVEDLSVPFGARQSLDPSFTPARVVVPVDVVMPGAAE